MGGRQYFLAKRYRCPDCGTATTRPRRCSACYLKFRRRCEFSVACVDCGKPCRRGSQRCRACYEACCRGAYRLGRPSYHTPAHIARRIAAYAEAVERGLDLEPLYEFFRRGGRAAAAC